ncbi:helix-turn-helix domain-containing protein [Mesobacillus maritimus]|uniref:helix-turn-helix domain-containing protein n=1 Tax=Mesobacillus maritimus TaxID=1643336 RepID=UPI00203D225C|nr:helix-turn-helix transcriptional regulator [Mesobacillus maritimus]MCM3584973.1 helix-turn-helix domain-containing protein [Mesobacillus maritimus]
MEKKKQLNLNRVKEQMKNRNVVHVSSSTTLGYSSLINTILGSTEVRKAIKRIKNETFKASLGQYISQIIISKGLSNKEVIEKAGFSKDYFYQVLNGRKKQPGRDKVLQLCFGLELGVEDSNTLLKKAGHNELYARNERDVIIMLCINNSYSLDETDEILFELQHDTLIPNE